MKRLFLTLAVAALAFTACDDNDGDGAPGSFTFTATVTDAPTQLKEVRAVTYDNGSVVEIATAAFSGTKFTMTLPATPSEEALAVMENIEEHLPEEVTLSDGDAKAFWITFMGFDDDGTEICTFYNRTANGASEIQYLYVDRDVDITGDYIEETTEIHYSLNGTLKKGWNRILMVFSANKSVTVTSPVRTGTEVGWIIPK